MDEKNEFLLLVFEPTGISSYSYSVLRLLGPTGKLSDAAIGTSEFRPFIFVNPYSKYHVLGHNTHWIECLRAE